MQGSSYNSRVPLEHMCTVVWLNGHFGFEGAKFILAPQKDPYKIRNTFLGFHNKDYSI